MNRISDLSPERDDLFAEFKNFVLDRSSDESRSVTPVAEYEHSLPSTPGTQSPCPASEPIAGPHARRPMGGLGPPAGGTPQHRVAVTFREQQAAHYNSPASNCNSPRYRFVSEHCIIERRNAYVLYSSNFDEVTSRL